MIDYLATGTGDHDWFRLLLRARSPVNVAVDGRDSDRWRKELATSAPEDHAAHSHRVRAVAEEPSHHDTTTEAEVRYDELGGVLRPLSELLCFVCGQVMSESRGVLDGRVHRIGLAQSGTNAGSWIWGPVAVHVGCFENLSIPLEDVGVSDYETRIDTVPYDWALQTCTKRAH